MIEFDDDTLLKLAQSKLDAGDYSDAWGLASRATRTASQAELAASIAYANAKYLSSCARYKDAHAMLGNCVSSSMSRLPFKPLIDERRRLLKVLITGGVRDVLRDRIVEGLSVREVQELPSDRLSPSIWYVGCAAAYRSAYDRQRYDALSRLIRRLKRGGADVALGPLGDYLADFVFWCTPLLETVDVIVPVPTSPDRWDRRGYQIPLGKV